MGTELEAVRYLVANDERLELLRVLEESHAPRDLHGSLSVSRSTVQRILSGFSERGWVDRCEGGYRRTESGEMVLRKIEELTQTIEFTSAFAPFLSEIEPFLEEPSLNAFGDVTVTESKASHSHEPIRRYRAVLEQLSFERFRGATPVITPVLEEIHQPLFEDSNDAELIVTNRELEELEADWPGRIENVTDLPDFDLYACSVDDPVGVSIIDEHAFLGAYRDGRLYRLLDGKSSTFRSLVRDVYHSFRKQSELFETDGLDKSVQ